MFTRNAPQLGVELRPLWKWHGFGGARSPRVAIYSHDAQGLGHLRRNLLIARSLITEECRPSVLVISGLRESSAFEFPPGVDSITLPSVGKGADGSYHARSLRLETAELVRIRQRLLSAAVESFRPDVLIVDKLPVGFSGELRPALQWLRARTGARIVLGLRDVLDEPAAVAREWARDRCFDAIRSFYDRIWVYGDRSLYDLAAEYAVPPDLAARIRYCGYLNPRDVPPAAPACDPHCGHDLTHLLGLPSGSLTLCLIGGGRDGVPLAAEFLRAALPRDGGGALVCGPLMEREDREDLRALGAARPDMRIVEFIADPHPLICCADRIIAMGGYNTVCEALAFQKRTLVVPRVTPRTEQLIRAERLASRGLLDVLHPRDLAADALSRWIADEPPVRRAAARGIDFGGAARLPQLLQEVLAPDLARARERVLHG